MALVHWVVYALGGVELTAWVVAGWRTPEPGGRVAGLVLALVGYVLVGVARWQLGEAFTVQAKARRLVTTGLYARVRNPIYLAGMMLFAGLVIYFGRLWLLLLLLPIFAVQQRRARREAEVLEAAFGQQYAQYRQRSWF